MRKIFASIILAASFAAPVEAAAWQNEPIDNRTGAFLGARLKLPLGRQRASTARAELAFAPTQSRASSSGMVRTRIGEGLSFGFSSHSKPTLNLAGMRADAALGLARSSQSKTDQKLGVSTTGWIAIGVGAAIVVAGVGYLLLVDHINDCEARENGC